jgi:hypothetical protein
LVSLLASCQLHGIEPWGYLRDLSCLLPSWSSRRVLELAPVLWRQTLEQPEVQQRLDGNIFRRASLPQLVANEYSISARCGPRGGADRDAGAL